MNNAISIMTFIKIMALGYAGIIFLKAILSQDNKTNDESHEDAESQSDISAQTQSKSESNNQSKTKSTTAGLILAALALTKMTLSAMTGVSNDLYNTHSKRDYLPNKPKVINYTEPIEHYSEKVVTGKEIIKICETYHYNSILVITNAIKQNNTDHTLKAYNYCQLVEDGNCSTPKKIYHEADGQYYIRCLAKCGKMKQPWYNNKTDALKNFFNRDTYVNPHSTFVAHLLFNKEDNKRCGLVIIEGDQ